MAKVMAVTHVTLDGVVQGPARPDEDTRNGFAQGGWAAPYGDEIMAATMGPGTGPDGGGGLLLGRWTYESLYRVWPHRTDNPFTERLNSADKYVASNSLTEPLPWENSTLLRGDVAGLVADLRNELPGDLVVLGSGRLLQSLMRSALVDVLLLAVYPLVLGSGARLFPADGTTTPLRLVETKPTSTGVVITRYELPGRGRRPDLQPTDGGY